MDQIESLERLWARLNDNQRQELEWYTNAMQSNSAWNDVISQLKHTGALQKPEGANLKFWKEGLRRLKFRIYDYMLTDAAITNSSLSEWFTNTLIAGKCFFQAFSNYNHPDDRRELMARAIHLAEKYEAFWLLSELYSWALDDHAKESVGAWKEWDVKMRSAIKKAAATHSARSLHARYYADLVDFSANRDKFDFDQANETVISLEKCAKKGGSLAKFYYGKVKTDLLARLGEFHEMESTGHELIELLDSSPAIYKPDRVSTVYSDLADNCLLLHQYERGELYADRALSFPQMGQVNRTNILFTKFFLSFYAGRFDISAESLRQISKPGLTAFKFHYERVLFYSAWLHNANGDYKASDLALSKLKAVKIDEPGYYLGIRLLSIKNAVEDERIDSAQKKIEAFRKFIRKLEKGNLLSKRDLMTYHVLSEWERNSFAGSPNWSELPPPKAKGFDVCPIEKWGSEVFMVA